MHKTFSCFTWLILFNYDALGSPYRDINLIFTFLSIDMHQRLHFFRKSVNDYKNLENDGHDLCNLFLIFSVFIMSAS